MQIKEHPGEITQRGRERQWRVLGFETVLKAKTHSVILPVGRFSPLLVNTYANKKEIPELTMRMWRPNAGSAIEENYLTVRFERCRIGDLRMWQTDTEVLHEATFKCERVEYTDPRQGIQAADDWVQ